jgi:hypothetical protein
MVEFKARRKTQGPPQAATGTSHAAVASGSASMGNMINMNNMGNMANLGMIPQQAMGMSSGHQQMGGMVPHPHAAMGMIPQTTQQMLHTAPHPQSQLAHHSQGHMPMPPKQPRMEQSSGSSSESSSESDDSDDGEEESD